MMKKPKGWKEGYKVVTDDMKSVYFYRLNKYACIYTINEIIKPKKGCGPLGIFMDKNVADHFSNHNGSKINKIFKCFYKPSKQKSLYIPRTRETQIRMMGFENYSTKTKIHQVPDYDKVDYATQVILTEEVS